MQKTPLKLNHIRAARGLRAGANPDAVGNELGISKRNLDKIESLYAGIPDALLASIERLLHDRDQLRHIISSLLQRSDLSP
jgi:hypothetical protein